MSRYVTKATRPKRGSDDHYYPISQQIVHPHAIVEPPVDSGLLDQDGRRVYRVPDEIGFVPRREGK